MTEQADRVAGGLAFLWPLCFLYRYVIPNRAVSLQIGNDFEGLYYQYKLYLLDALSQGRLPLWSPSEAAGFPFFSSPFTQALYPLNAPLAIFYRMAGGYTYTDHQVFTVLGLCIYSLGLFLWLRAIRVGCRAALLATLILGVSFKLTELVRFPNAVHEAAWMPWLLLGVTNLSRRPGWVRGAIITAGATVMLLTGGYPYYIYYSGFLVGPYVLLLLARPTRGGVLHGAEEERFVSRRRFAGAAIVAFGLPLLICSPYLLRMQALLDATVDRGGTSFAYSTEHVFNWIDTLGSLVFPPAAPAEGWYYFSGVALLLILVYLGVVLWCPDYRRREGRLALTVLVWGGALTYITYGGSSWLFRLFWHVLPGFAQLRAWGRMNIILVPLIALLLGRAYMLLEEQVHGPRAQPGEMVSRVKVMTVCLTGAYLAVLAVQLTLYFGGVRDAYWTTYFLRYHIDERCFIASGALGYLALAGVILVFGRRRIRSSQGMLAVLIALVTLATWDMRVVGARQWSVRKLVPPQRAPLPVLELATQAFRTPRVNEAGTIQLQPAFNLGYIPNWYFERYVAFHETTYAFDDYAYRVVSSEEEPAFRILMGMEDGTRLFFSTRIDHESIRAFLQDAESAERQGKVSGFVVSYTGDALDLEIATHISGYLSFIDNWDPDWRCDIDGNRAPISRLFGTFKAVRLEPGRHRVRFVYAPGIFSGWGLSGAPHPRGREVLKFGKARRNARYLGPNLAEGLTGPVTSTAIPRPPK